GNADLSGRWGERNYSRIFIPVVRSTLTSQSDESDRRCAGMAAHVAKYLLIVETIIDSPAAETHMQEVRRRAWPGGQAGVGRARMERAAARVRTIEGNRAVRCEWSAGACRGREWMAVLRLPPGARVRQVALGDDGRAVELPQAHRAIGVLEQEIGVPIRGEVIDRNEQPSRSGILQRCLGGGRRSVHQPDARRAVVVLPC